MNPSVRCMLAALLLLGPAAPGCGGGSDCARPPVVLVHGYNGRGAHLEGIRRALLDAGWRDADIASPDLPRGAPVEAWGRRVVSEIARLQARQGCGVALVGYSMGGLAARWAAAAPAAAGKVLRVVTVGTPHAGTPLADACDDAACRDMRAGSPFLEALPPPGAGGPAQVAILSPADRTVPAASARLPGARNVSVCCPAHAGLPSHSGVQDAVIEALAH